jgi:hypothetical protein
LNRALRLGRVPALVVALLNAMDKASVSAHVTVAGMRALYAYDAAAGVCIEGVALATQDVDFFFGMPFFSMPHHFAFGNAHTSLINTHTLVEG